MKKKANSLGINIVFNMLYQVTTIIIPLITTPYIARVLGSENSGVFNYTLTISQYFMLFGRLGFENYGNRQIATVKDDQEELNRTFSSMYGLQLLTGLLASLAYVIYLVTFDIRYPEIMAICGLYVFSTLINISWLYYGLELFKKTALRAILLRIIGTVCIFGFVKKPNDLWIYVLINASLELIGQGVLWIDVSKHISFVRVQFKYVLQHVTGCTILFLPIILINIYRLMAKQMLGIMHTMSEIAFYSYADKIIELPFFLITAVGVAMLPRMTNMVARGEKQKSLQYIKMTFKINTVAASAIVFGIIAVRKDLITQFLGNGYDKCTTLIAILAPMIIVRAWANVVRTQYLMPNSKDRSYITSLLVGVVTILIFNLLLIPKHGAIGAAIGTLAAESAVAVSQILAGRHALPIRKYLSNNMPYLFWGFIMYLAVSLFARYINGSLIALILQIFVGVVVYTALALPFLVYQLKHQKE